MRAKLVVQGKRFKRRQLSRTLAYVLRHNPQALGLHLDSEGWVELPKLVAALRTRPAFASVTEHDVEAVVANSDKQRFEIRGGRIRALYGHSVQNPVAKQPVEPPEILYHGTAPERVAAIGRQGLLPMGRQFVHLSTTVADAVAVGRRRSKRPCVLVVEARKAFLNGIRFYRGNEQIWLADSIPPEFIRLQEQLQDQWNDNHNR